MVVMEGLLLQVMLMVVMVAELVLIQITLEEELAEDLAEKLAAKEQERLGTADIAGVPGWCLSRHTRPS